MSYVEQHMRESLKDHVLEPHADLENLKAWYLKKPGRTRMMSTLILFTVEGIVLMGDLTPCQNGVVSALGYGVNWFAGKLSEDYLCEKFLRKEFVPEVAERRFKEEILHYRRDGSLTKEKAREGWDGIESKMEDGLSGHAFYELYWEIMNDSPEIRYDYNPGDAGWLCAIQQRFAQLYVAMAVTETA